MNTQLAKWGNSLAVRVPKVIADQAKLTEGDRVEMSITEEGAILLRPARRKYSLEQLVAGITPENRHEETDWGGPVGKEAW